MRNFLIANPKGGCGKSTLSVHLASWFARCDEVVYLADMDRQQSSRQWLDLRPEALPGIRRWEMEGEELPPPRDASIGIVDTPAGLPGKQLRKLLREADRVIVPMLPSRFDMMAGADFFAELAEIKAIRKDKIGVAIVGMRVDYRTNSTQQMIEYLQQFDLPLVTCIRNAQRYVRAVETGVTLFDSSTPPAADFAQWRPLLDWLNRR